MIKKLKNLCDMKRDILFSENIFLYGTTISQVARYEQ